MKLIFNILTTGILYVQSFYCMAQISPFTYQQGFEDEFVLSSDTCMKASCEVEFLPAWKGNEVRATSRIFKDKKHTRTGSGALCLSPITGFDPEVTWNMNHSEVSEFLVTFYIKNIKNGGEKDLKESLLSLTVFSDSTLSQQIVIDTFQNETGAEFKKYTYTSLGLKASKINLKLSAKRFGSLAGSAAKILIDDVEIHSGGITQVSTGNYEAVRITSPIPITNGMVSFNTNVSGQAVDMNGTCVMVFQEQSDIQLHGWKAGFYIISLNNGQHFKIANLNSD